MEDERQDVKPDLTPSEHELSKPGNRFVADLVIAARLVRNASKAEFRNEPFPGALIHPIYELHAALVPFEAWNPEKVVKSGT